MDTSRVRAQNAVFNTYELLESIILAIPAEDILFAAQLNQHWHSVVATSTPVGVHVQHGLGPLLNFWYHPAAMGDFVESSFLWGKVIIRRLGASEGIAILPNSTPSRYCPLTRPVVADEGNRTVKVQWTSERKVWEVSFLDGVTGTMMVGFISSYSNSRLVKYLAKHYGGSCASLKILKPLCSGQAALM